MAKRSSRKDKDDSNNPDLNLPGIGNYIFQKTVGEGNFAKVKLANHKLTSQEVAIKIIDKTTLDEKKLGKLYREVRIMKMLHHPNIVKLFEVIETKTTLFLVMEYASGGELYDYLVVHGKMKEKEARAKFRQILSALNYCHKQRVIHRDLKAENLLLDSNFNIKIADFGFSNHFDPDSKLDTFCGSPPYAAPELFQGRRYTGPEVDLWSMGVILYVLTTGCLPFDGKNLQEMRESVCRGKYRIPFFLSDGCEKLLRKFLVRDPAKRASLDILIDDPWIMEGYEDSPITTDLSTSVREDEAVLAIMEKKHNISKESVLEVLRNNEYNDISAIYFLLYFDKDNIEKKSNDEDIVKVSTAGTTKKEVAPKAMIAIDEDSVLPDAESFNKRESPTASPHSTSKSSAHGKIPALVAGGRRKRAATVNNGGASPETSPAPSTVLTKDIRPKSALPEDQENLKEIPSTDAEHSNVIDSTRKRTNTIVGILRSGLKNEQEKGETESSGDEDRPRSLRFTFNSNTTSSKPPDEIIVEIIKCCNKLGFTHRLLTRYLLECTSSVAEKDPLKLEIEVCKLPRLNNLHGLRFKRLSGPSAEYKEACEGLLNSIQI